MGPATRRLPPFQRFKVALAQALYWSVPSFHLEMHVRKTDASSLRWAWRRIESPGGRRRAEHWHAELARAEKAVLVELARTLCVPVQGDGETAGPPLADKAGADKAASSPLTGGAPPPETSQTAKDERLDVRDIAQRIGRSRRHIDRVIRHLPPDLRPRDAGTERRHLWWLAEDEIAGWWRRAGAWMAAHPRRSPRRRTKEGATST